MTHEGTIQTLLAAGEADQIAIADQFGVGITYQELRVLIHQTHGFLAHRGIGKADVVATALKNCPQSAMLLLAITSYCQAAPLNPDYRIGEIEFALRDMRARLLITAGDLPEAEEAAARCSVDLAQIAGSGSNAYALTANAARNIDVAPLDTGPGPDDVALRLHTSGTTARPKQVALTHRNLYRSACGAIEVLQLGSDDRCLLVMPLFHVHGLVAGLLATIGAGATVCCPPGFQATAFYSWLDSSRATWYTAVPAMHQMILARAQRNERILASHNLRFIRSASSVLYGSVREELEATFRVRVLNAYGMTEAAHQIASTRLSTGLSNGSGSSHPSVGYSSGPAIAVLNSRNEMAACGERGEVILRGEQIIDAYVSPASANDAAFWNGWLRTGDEGFLDTNGALRLTGRLKEIINCGGEKISPAEVEEVLLRESAVAQAVVFAVPHPTLGEEVGAAVVLQEGAAGCTERVLLDAVTQQLSRHKAPRSIRIVDEIPKGPTGKVQRTGMAERLNLAQSLQP